MLCKSTARLCVGLIEPMPLRTIQTTEGLPVFLDSGNPTAFATFQVLGGSERVGYRVGYTAPNGTLRVKVSGGDDVEIVGKPYVPIRQVVVPRGMSQSALEGFITPGCEFTWASDAETVLSRPLVIAHENVVFKDARLQLVPMADNARVGVHVRAPGFRADNAVVRGNPAHTGLGRDRGSFGSVAFNIQDGGSAVIRWAKGSRIDTLARVEGDKHLGLVVEKPALTDLLAYALYVNAGDAGVSWWGGTVNGPGNEPWFRVIDDPKRGVRTANGYLGHVMATMPDRNIGKDGFTPRDCKRWAADTCKFINAQIRVGQDDTGVADGGHDPEDILVFNCLTNKYIEVKRGSLSEKATRIFIIGPTVPKDGPWTDKPIHVHDTRDSLVTGAAWLGGGTAPMVNGGTGNTNLKWERNGGTFPDLTFPGVVTPPPVVEPPPVVTPPPVDPQIAIDRARLLEISARLTSIDAERDVLIAERAVINARLGQPTP